MLAAEPSAGLRRGPPRRSFTDREAIYPKLVRDGELYVEIHEKGAEDSDTRPWEWSVTQRYPVEFPAGGEEVDPNKFLTSDTRIQLASTKTGYPGNYVAISSPVGAFLAPLAGETVRLQSIPGRFVAFGRAPDTTPCILQWGLHWLITCDKDSLHATRLGSLGGAVESHPIDTAGATSCDAWIAGETPETCVVDVFALTPAPRPESAEPWVVRHTVPRGQAGREPLQPLEIQRVGGLPDSYTIGLFLKDGSLCLAGCVGDEGDFAVNIYRRRLLMHSEPPELDPEPVMFRVKNEQGYQLSTHVITQTGKDEVAVSWDRSKLRLWMEIDLQRLTCTFNGHDCSAAAFFG